MTALAGNVNRTDAEVEELLLRRGEQAALRGRALMLVEVLTAWNRIVCNRPIDARHAPELLQMEDWLQSEMNRLPRYAVAMANDELQARERGVPKSTTVREAISAYVAGRTKGGAP